MDGTNAPLTLSDEDRALLAMFCGGGHLSMHRTGDPDDLFPRRFTLHAYTDTSDAADGLEVDKHRVKFLMRYGLLKLGPMQATGPRRVLITTVGMNVIIAFVAGRYAGMPRSACYLTELQRKIMIELYDGGEAIRDLGNGVYTMMRCGEVVAEPVFRMLQALDMIMLTTRAERPGDTGLWTPTPGGQDWAHHWITQATTAAS